MPVKSEGQNQRLIWLDYARRTMARMFRVNTGRAYVSGLGPRGVQRHPNGSVTIQAARPVALGFGLPNGDPLKGTSDLNGWTPVEITPEMVGSTIAVYTALETKRTKGGRISADQENYCQQVRNAGGIAGIAASPEQAAQIFYDWKRQFSEKLL